MEHQKILSLVCIDLSVAFDMVDHEILEQVLQNQYGITGTEQYFNGIKHISDLGVSR